MAKSKSKSGKAESKASKTSNSSGKKTALPKKAVASAEKASKPEAKKKPTVAVTKAALTKAPVKKIASVKTAAPAKKTAPVKKEAPKKAIVAKPPVSKPIEKAKTAPVKNSAPSKPSKTANGAKAKTSANNGTSISPSNTTMPKTAAPGVKETLSPVTPKTATPVTKVTEKKAVGDKPAKKSKPAPPSVDRKHFEERVVFKRDILNRCIELQAGVINTAKRAMDEAQESANEEKGSTEEKFDSFRESMQITRDMYARQLQEAIDGLALLKRIVIVPIADSVKLGAVVHTNLQNYFISASLGELDYDENTYMAISTQTPIYQALAGKKKGDTFVFRDQKYRILEIF